MRTVAPTHNSSWGVVWTLCEQWEFFSLFSRNLSGVKDTSSVKDEVVLTISKSGHHRSKNRFKLELNYAVKT